MSKSKTLYGRGRWKILPPEYQHVIEQYKSGKTHLELATQYGVTIKTISTILKKNQIKPRGNLQYEPNHTYLDEIDSAEKAYFLGWMWSDGNVDKHLKSIKITLQHGDGYMLEYFKQRLFLGEKRPNLYPDFHDFIKYQGKRQKKYALKVSSQRLCESLGRLGCHPNKSLTIGFPSLPIEYVWHFLRGSLDGDGCIYLRKRKAAYDISFNGSKMFCKSLMGFLEAHGINARFSDVGNIARVMVSRKAEVLTLLDNLYRDSGPDLRLNRKYNLYKHIHDAEQPNSLPIH